MSKDDLYKTAAIEGNHGLKEDSGEVLVPLLGLR